MHFPGPAPRPHGQSRRTRSVAQSYKLLATWVAAKAAAFYVAVCFQVVNVGGASGVTIALLVAAAGAATGLSMLWCVPRACVRQQDGVVPIDCTVTCVTRVQA